jgi:hypothetical protein
MKRLIKAYENGFTVPAPILVPDFQNKIENDEICDITYDSGIDKTFYFEQELDNAEWALQASIGGKRMRGNWIKAFISALDDNKNEDIKKDVTADLEVDEATEMEEDNIEAEINVNDLPTVIWNDEEYRVLFDDAKGTAEVLNDYGNHVITLNATTIDEVNKQLGDSTIVAKRMKRLNRIAEQLNCDLLAVKPDYARIEDFTEEEFDAKMIEFENMLDSIELTQNKIEEDNNTDRTQRKEKYYINYIPLNEEDEELFQAQVCPNCNAEVKITSQDDEYAYVTCEDCGAQYRVNLETGDIDFIADDTVE